MKIDDFLKEMNEGWKQSLEKDKAQFYDAFSFAKEAHKNQKRDEGSPYINHIVGVIKILKDELKIDDYDLLTVAALHDVIEDTEYTYEDIKNRYGLITAEYVDKMTKKEGQRVDEYIQEIKDFAYSHQLLMIKLADRLNNVRSLLNITDKADKRDKIKKYIIETEDYYIPLAKAIKEKVVCEELTKALNEVKGVI